MANVLGHYFPSPTLQIQFFASSIIFLIFREVQLIHHLEVFRLFAIKVFHFLAGYFIPDVLVAATIGVVTGLSVGPLVPVVGNWLARSSIMRFLLHITVLALALSSQFFPYSNDAPKRVVFQHTVLTAGIEEIAVQVPSVHSCWVQCFKLVQLNVFLLLLNCCLMYIILTSPAAHSSSLC